MNLNVIGVGRVLELVPFSQVDLSVQTLAQIVVDIQNVLEDRSFALVLGNREGEGDMHIITDLIKPLKRVLLECLLHHVANRAQNDQRHVPLRVVLERQQIILHFLAPPCLVSYELVQPCAPLIEVSLCYLLLLQVYHFNVLVEHQVLQTLLVGIHLFDLFLVAVQFFLHCAGSYVSLLQPVFKL